MKSFSFFFWSFPNWPHGGTFLTKTKEDPITKELKEIRKLSKWNYWKLQEIEKNTEEK